LKDWLAHHIGETGPEDRIVFENQSRLNSATVPAQREMENGVLR
jgi:hypothetical protein